MSTTWNGTTLPGLAPDGFLRKRIMIGGNKRSLDGSLHVDVLAHKYVITLRWRMLSEADRDTIENLFDSLRTGTHPLVLEDGSSYTVSAASNGYSEDEHWTGSARRYDVTLTMEEA